jgi:hypothetical protein
MVWRLRVVIALIERPKVPTLPTSDARTSSVFALSTVFR